MPQSNNHPVAVLHTGRFASNVTPVHNLLPSMPEGFILPSTTHWNGHLSLTNLNRDNFFSTLVDEQKFTANSTPPSNPLPPPQPLMHPHHHLANSTSHLGPEPHAIAAATAFWNRKLSLQEAGSRAKNLINSRPQFALRITKIETEPAMDPKDRPKIRPTFYLEMPDLSSPEAELWKLSFRCNLFDSMDDIKLVRSLLVLLSHTHFLSSFRVPPPHRPMRKYTSKSAKPLSAF
ncbi:hypothetical protein Ciccas_011801 [Cichlidogyrus casuarinus]|uniref:Uncharacterized protein n=1 Tax=Cichlidogyrus casuarinus TaxID=1844966 RepID=A0ABD2PV31_9PLAT